MNSFSVKTLRFFLSHYLKNSVVVKDFYRSFDSPEAAQLKTLNEIVARLKIKNQVHSSHITYQEFVKSFPIVTYDEIADQIKDLGSSPVDFYEWTSGSSKARKQIPYTPELRQSFSNLFEVWLLDLLQNLPTLYSGKTFFSISPMTFDNETGIHDDFDYIKNFTKFIISRFSILPSKIKKLRNPEEFRKVVSLYLLATPDLEIISIWSPSFILNLLDYVEKHRKELIPFLENGQIQTEVGVFSLGKHAKSQAKILKDDQYTFQKIWPHLKFISCWGHGTSRSGFELLKKKFPQVLFQPKGLLATEAPLTVPLMNSSAQLPLLNEVFYEFEDQNGQIYPLWETCHNTIYQLILTQKSGLTRYRIGDNVLVKKTASSMSVEFVSRAQVSDLVGEKLHESFLIDCLQQLNLHHYACVFIPDQKNQRYVMLTDFHQAPQQKNQIEEYLMKNPHYHLARSLEQLKPLECLHTDSLGSLYERFMNSRQIKLGDIKWATLIVNPEVAESFLEFASREIKLKNFPMMHT